MNSVTFKSVGERWCYAIPNVSLLQDDNAVPYLDLNVGDILTSRVGHADYNTADFDVELRIEEKYNGGEGDITYDIRLVKANGKNI